MKPSAILLLLVPSPATADVAEQISAYSKSYIACFQLRKDNEKRLNCYDQLIEKTTELMVTATESIQTGCSVEDWNYTKRGSHLYLTGATSCANGKLNYRLYDEEQFLTSGFTFIKGYAFQTYTDISDAPSKLNMKYVIE